MITYKITAHIWKQEKEKTQHNCHAQVGFFPPDIDQVGQTKDEFRVKLTAEPDVNLLEVAYLVFRQSRGILQLLFSTKYMPRSSRKY